MIRLLTLINHEVLRQSLHELFELAGDIHMSAIAASAEECLEHLANGGKERFHGLLLDTAHAKELRVLLENVEDVLLDLPIFALCPRHAPPVIRRVLSENNTTLLEKDGDPTQLIATIRASVGAAS